MICYPGDVSETELGLSPSDYLHLIGQTDVVVHCGAEVNMIKPYSVLARANVGGTANVLDFAVRRLAPSALHLPPIPVHLGQIAATQIGTGSCRGAPHLYFYHRANGRGASDGLSPLKRGV